MIESLSRFLRLIRFKLRFRNRLQFFSLWGGDSIYFRKGLSINIGPQGLLSMGKHVFLNNYCSITCLHRVSIGNDCIFGENVRIYDHNHKHEINGIPYYKQGFTIGEIAIGNNCWLGSNVVVLKGVKIGDNCVIGANTIVYKSIPENSIVVNRQDLLIIKKNK